MRQEVPRERMRGTASSEADTRLPFSLRDVFRAIVEVLG